VFKSAELGAVHMSWDNSCNENIFLAIKDGLNELYTLAGIELS
jgi:hypothetical protein